MQLRYYQEEAKKALYDFFRTRSDQNPCIVLPTGAGKTPLLASICSDVLKSSSVSGVKKKILVVSHVKELLEQACEKLQKIDPTISVGVYSASLKSRDVVQDVIVAGVQSIYKNVFLLGKVDLVIVDECRLIPPEGDGQYQTMLKNLRRDNPNLKLVGLTATPYRLKTGWLCGPNNFLNEICYEIDVKRLIQEGYLCRLESRFVENGVNTSDLHTRAGEFVPEEVDRLVNNDAVVCSACAEIVDKFHKYNRRKCLLFAANIEHARNIKTQIERFSGEKCGVILGETKKREREETLKKFKNGEIRFIVNVGVLTTGFDEPGIDLVALLRPTQSHGLYSQMVGRGLRICANKDYCMVLDFGQNIERLGPIDEVRVKSQVGRLNDVPPVKVCPDCELYIHAALRVCPHCGFLFPPRETSGITPESSSFDVVSKKYSVYSTNVVRAEFSKHIGKTGVSSLIISYRLENGGVETEWGYVEHKNELRRSFIRWWHARSYAPVPATVDEALKLIEQGRLARTKRITVRRYEGESLDEVISSEVDRESFDFNGGENVKRFCNACIFFRRGACKMMKVNVDKSKEACAHFIKKVSFYDDDEF